MLAFVLVIHDPEGVVQVPLAVLHAASFGIQQFAWDPREAVHAALAVGLSIIQLIPGGCAVQ